MKKVTQTKVTFFPFLASPQILGSLVFLHPMIQWKDFRNVPAVCFPPCFTCMHSSSPVDPSEESYSMVSPTHSTSLSLIIYHVDHHIPSWRSSCPSHLCRTNIETKAWSILGIQYMLMEVKMKKCTPSQGSWIFHRNMNFKTAVGPDRWKFKSWLYSLIWGVLKNQIRQSRNLNREAQDLWWLRRQTLLSARLLRFHSHLCPLSAVQPWETFLASLKFSICIYTTRIIQHLPHCSFKC